MSNEVSALMSGPQRQALARAYRELQASASLQAEMAGPVVAACAAGWPRRVVSQALGIPKERTERLRAIRPAGKLPLPRYRRGDIFPSRAVDAYVAAVVRALEQRRAAGARLSALLRQAHGAGHSYRSIGRALGISGEWARRLALPEPSAPSAGEPRIFTPRPSVPAAAAAVIPVLSPEEKQRMLTLAAAARTACRLPDDPGQERLPEVLSARKASEDLSELIIDAKGRGILWRDLDEACGYSRGSARARAKRHGYGTLPPSFSGYARSPRNRVLTEV